MKKKLQNLTGSDITIACMDTKHVIKNNSGFNPSLISTNDNLEIINAIIGDNVSPVPIYSKYICGIKMLPPIKEDTFYITTKAVATFLSEHHNYKNIICADPSRAKMSPGNKIMSISSFIKIQKNEYQDIENDDIDTIDTIDTTKPITIINKTPHDITLAINNNTYVMSKSSTPVRVNSAQYDTEIIEFEAETESGIKTIILPVYVKCFNKVINLPKKEPNTIYIVSKPAASYLHKFNRTDILITDNTRSNRDNDNKVTSISSFIRLYPSQKNLSEISAVNNFSGPDYANVRE